ncbi:MAG: PadR family transcriptional regulator [Actinobacteria bacterium]|nr:PadR family transcriptional regulator [Actinomycetota bacterium]
MASKPKAPAKSAAKRPAAAPKSSQRTARPKPAGKAVAKAASAAAGHYLAEQRAVLEAVAEPAAAPAARGRKRGGADPLTAELRSQLLPLLVLHFMSEGPTYGNQLIDRITELTGGVLTVNPNTMYPLLRGFEAKGLIEGQWEHPERRSRRFYSLTPAGVKELARLQPAARKSLESLGRTLAEIQGELFG